MATISELEAILEVNQMVEMNRINSLIHPFIHDNFNKWKNNFARNYGVNATPSFYILDADKKIIAKPDDVDELTTFFTKN